MNCTRGILDLARLVGNGHPMGIFKRLKFDNTTKWYVQKPESVLENEMYNIHRDFEIQKDH